jgi:hypothetical protein
MKIREFLKGHFQKRLEQSQCLVLYDPDKRYREIAQDMEDGNCRVIDGSHSTILAREDAMETWRRLADSSSDIQPMVIYLPIPKPKTEVERQQNPYQPFAIGGAEFPYDDGDSYQALCRKAKPDFEQQVDQLFAAGIPDFDTVDAIDSGTNWPKLRSLLKAESAAEILVAILSPTETQQKALEQDEAWPAEFKDFARSTLGLKLKTKSQKWRPIQEELARYVLLSEFALDFPGELPVELKDVPHAESTYANLIHKVCETLRTSQPHQNPYMEMANKVASELSLEDRLKHIQDFGKRDTFSFVERTFLLQFIAAAERGDGEGAREIAAFRMNSIWTREAERQLLWTISERALELSSMCEEIRPDWKNHAGSLSALFSYYAEKLRALDMLHRVFEQAVNDAYGDLGVVAEFVENVRRRYLKLAEEVQARFVALVEDEGWPPGGQLRQTQVFEKFLAPHLDERRRAALFLVDALRFELAAELLARVTEDNPAEIYAVAAQLPTTTKVGMAALMPEADGNLRLVRKNGDLVPVIKEREIKDPSDRFKAIQALYGDRCVIVDLDQFLRKRKLHFHETIQLLVIKTLDIDELGTFLAHDAARLIPSVLKKLPAAVTKLKELEFEQVVLATDHGFVLLDEQEPGDLVPKPAGDWVHAKGRYLLGSGSGSGGAMAFDAQQVGIKGEIDTLVVPRSFGTFSRSEPYFHGGLSLQECVLPVLSINLKKKGKKEGRAAKLRLSYKGEATGTVTTRRPMIEIVLFQEQIEAFGAKELEFQLEAHAKGKVVGEAASCQYLDPSTNFIKIKLGQAIKVPLRMNEEFEGTFEVRAIDPRTQANHATLKLKTNYMDGSDGRS